MRTEQPITYNGQIETNNLSGPKTKVRFGELGIGEVFFFNNQRIVKTGEYTAVSDRKINKQPFLFFKKDVVKVDNALKSKAVSSEAGFFTALMCFLRLYLMATGIVLKRRRKSNLRLGSVVFLMTLVTIFPKTSNQHLRFN